MDLCEGPSPGPWVPSPMLAIRPEKLIGTQDNSLEEHGSAARENFDGDLGESKPECPVDTGVKRDSLSLEDCTSFCLC